MRGPLPRSGQAADWDRAAQPPILFIKQELVGKTPSQCLHGELIFGRHMVAAAEFESWIPFKRQHPVVSSLQHGDAARDSSEKADVRYGRYWQRFRAAVS